MSFKNYIFILIFIFSNTFAFAEDVQVKIEFIENGPLGSDVVLHLENSGMSNIIFRQFKREACREYLVLVVDPIGNLIRRKSWKKVEPIKIRTETGYYYRKNTGYITETFTSLNPNSSKEMYTMLLDLMDIPCFKQHYVMFVLHNNKRLYKTNVLSFEKTGDRQMKQYDISKSGVPEAVLTTFSNEIKLLYQEEGLKPD